MSSQGEHGVRGGESGLHKASQSRPPPAQDMPAVPRILASRGDPRVNDQQLIPVMALVSAAAAVFAVPELGFGLSSRNPQLLGLGTLTLFIGVAALGCILAVRRGRTVLGVHLWCGISATILALVPVVSTRLASLSVTGALLNLLLIALFVSPRRMGRYVVVYILPVFVASTLETLASWPRFVPRGLLVVVPAGANVLSVAVVGTLIVLLGRILLRAVDSLEQRVRERTQELAGANEEIASALAALEQKDRLIQRDLQEARVFQQCILPLLPKSRVFEVGALFQPVDLVGGDIYDVVELTPGHCRVFLADATGHGVQASLRTMVLKSEYDRLKEVHATPESVLCELNARLVAAYPEQEMFCTGCCFDIVSSQTSITLRYASAAHPPLLRVGKEGVAEVYRLGTFLGASAEAAFDAVEVELAPGDLVLAYSDGVSEQQNSEGVMFPLERAVRKAVTEGRPVGTVLDDLLLRWNEFRGTTPTADDLTLVGVRVEHR